MASESQVKEYIAYWLQLGKQVMFAGGRFGKKTQRIIEGEQYSPEFEGLWQQVRSPSRRRGCYLEGTSETIDKLLKSDWEITDCPRCSMMKPQPIVGMSPISCPCEDLSNWPNLELPAPRKPVSDRKQLTAIANRLEQMGQKADLYAFSMAGTPVEIQGSEIRDRLRLQSELILNSAQEGICGFNQQGKITFVNPAGYRLLGYNSLELIGESIDKILSIAESSQSKSLSIENLIDMTLKEGSIQEMTNGIFWRQTQTSFPGEFAIAPIKQQGYIVGAVLTFKDITERLEIDRMKDEFISMVSHELRTPLTAIRGALGILSSGLLDRLPDKAQRMVEIAVKNTDRLLRLINDILDLDRISSGKVAIAKQKCDAGNLMLEAVESLQANADEKLLTIELLPIHSQIWADPDRVIQLLTNLLSNAIKFSDSGATVRLSAFLREPEILFEVTDRGRGIPADKINTIFGRFQQVDSSDSRLFGGTGLGLAICQTIVEQHQGRIWVESEEGQGSTFFFTLPIFCPERLVELSEDSDTVETANT